MIRLTAAALTLVSLLSACTEDEKACYDRIDADLKATFDFAIKSWDTDYANAAIDSQYQALAIYTDDDRNICDYVTAGAYLERK